MTEGPVLSRALELEPRVALRSEPFGALAYHYGNRRLVFLRHPDMVAVVRCLADHPSVEMALRSCGVEERRWSGFSKAIGSLLASGVLRERADSDGSQSTGSGEMGV
jgi:putative mycofactocin binding protein MftB